MQTGAIILHCTCVPFLTHSRGGGDCGASLRRLDIINSRYVATLQGERRPGGEQKERKERNSAINLSSFPRCFVLCDCFSRVRGSRRLACEGNGGVARLLGLAVLFLFAAPTFWNRHTHKHTQDTNTQSTHAPPRKCCLLPPGRGRPFQRFSEPPEFFTLGFCGRALLFLRPPCGQRKQQAPSPTSTRPALFLTSCGLCDTCWPAHMGILGRDRSRSLQEPRLAPLPSSTCRRTYPLHPALHPNP